MLTWTQFFIGAILPCALLGFTLPSASEHPSGPKRIEVTAKRFTFSPDQVTVKKGEPVVLAFHSEDVTHGIRIEELKIKTDIPKGHVTEVPFTATQTGDFPGRCAHFCGEGHGDMTFTVHVTE
jgi:cytochrome c oxidase subunit 2